MMFSHFREAKEKLKNRDDLKDKFKDVEFEKNDKYALVIAALVTFLPPIIIIVAILTVILSFIFLR